MIKKIYLGGDYQAGLKWLLVSEKIGWTQAQRKAEGLREIIVLVNRGCYGHSQRGQLKSIHREPVKVEVKEFILCAKE